MSGAETFRVPAEVYERHVGRYSRQLAVINRAELRIGHSRFPLVAAG